MFLAWIQTTEHEIDENGNTLPWTVTTPSVDVESYSFEQALNAIDWFSAQIYWQELERAEERYIYG